jgi:site-specific DNA-adenine methylase
VSTESTTDHTDDLIVTPLTAPFPWFGGKRRVTEDVWKRFGNVPNFIEPFFGSGAVLLARPHRPKIETVNDLDGYLANFWRAVQHDPDLVAYYACNPVNEFDLHARHLWLVNEGKVITDRLKVDPHFYDPMVAGWWLWGISCWIGGGFCSGNGPHKRPEATEGESGVNRPMPYMSSIGQGVNQGLLPGLGHVMPKVAEGVNGIHRQMPHLTGQGQGVNKGGALSIDEAINTGRGVSRVMPFLGGFGKGVNRKASAPGLVEALEGSMEARLAFTMEMMRDLCDRLRNVRVTCGEWDRILGPAVTTGNGVTAVFLDPPYGEDADCDQGVYAQNDSGVSAKVREWAIANGDNPKFRIALCGYEGEHPMPDTWETFAWKAAGGYGVQGKSEDARGKENAKRERIWFSPHCLKQTRPTQLSLLAALTSSDAEG